MISLKKDLATVEFGVTDIAVAPLRGEPSDASEMVSQVLFGECFKVLERRSKWSKIRLFNDEYEGWIDNKQFEFISEEDYNRISKISNSCVGHLFGEIESGGLKTIVSGGSVLPGLRNGAFKLLGSSYRYNGITGYSSSKFKKQRISETALLFLNTPYLWGGRNFMGIDCSGFVQVVYKINGIRLPRDSNRQAEMGDRLSFIEEAESGDLAFFDNSEGKITHVGIVLENNHIVHASGKVRIDRLDHQGIFNQSKNDYTHKLRFITKIM